MSYLLNLDKLEIGDIILESGSSKFSWWIKYGTNSKYSHAMIYVGHSIIHALTDGVYTENPQRIIVDSINNLKILRLKENNTLLAKEAVTNARHLIGSLYGKKEAIISVAMNKTKQNALSSTQFCSRLVAQVYFKAGISLVNNVDYCTPEDINNSTLLYEVTNCLREANIDEIDFANTYNPINENRKRTFIYLNKCRDLFKSRNIIIQSEHDLEIALRENRDLDNIVCQFIIDSKYLEHYNSDKIINPYRYNVQEYINKINESSTPINEVLRKELNNQIDNILYRTIKNYINSKQSYIDFKLKYYKLNIELCKNILKLVEEKVYIFYQISILMEEKEISTKCKEVLFHIDDTIRK